MFWFTNKGVREVAWGPGEVSVGGREEVDKWGRGRAGEVPPPFDCWVALPPD